MTARRRIGAVLGALLLSLALLPAGPVAAGDPPPPAVAEASSGAGPPAAPPAGRAGPKLDARAWVLMDGRSGEVLASHAASRRLPIASATKMMTAYVAMKELPLRRVVRASPYAAIYGESLLELSPGERISVRDLLYGLILRSGNDAAHALAIAAAGSEARFVRRMNRRAAALGLADTHFANPVGLDEAGNYSSAYDLAALGRRLLRIPAFARIAASRSARLRSLRPPRRIETLNDLLLRVPWATGIKTGHTFGADYVLVSSARRDGVELVAALLGAPSETARDIESLRLLEHGFSLHRKRKPVRAGQALASPSIRFGDEELALRAPRTIAVGLRRGQRLRVAVRAPREVEGPIRRGQALGRATVLVDSVPVGSVPLRAGRGVPAPDALDRLSGFAGENMAWLLAALSAILVGAFVIRRLAR